MFIYDCVTMCRQAPVEPRADITLELEDRQL